MAIATYSPHPILVDKDRKSVQAFCLDNETAEDFLQRNFPNIVEHPLVIYINGMQVSKESLSNIIIKNEDIIIVKGALEGDDSNPLGAVLAISVLAISLALFGPGGALVGPGALTATEAAYAGAVFAAGGLYVANMIAPVYNPKDLETGETSSPTYDLTGVQNRVRPYEALPLLFGRMKLVPDSGAKVFTEFIGDEVYLYHIYNFGVSYLQYEKFFIGDTEIPLDPNANDAFQDYRFQLSGYGGALTLFPGNVDTEEGAELTNAAGWIQRTSSSDTNKLGVDIVGTIFRLNSKGQFRFDTATFELEYRAVGSTTWLPMVAIPTSSSHTYYWSAGYYTQETTISGGTQTVWVQVTYGDTNGSSHSNGELYTTIQAGPSSTPGDTSGFSSSLFNAINVVWRYMPYSELSPGSQDAPSRVVYSVTNTTSITNNTADLVRKTYTKEVSPDQYEVRVRKTSGDPTDDQHVSNFSWTQLKSYQVDSGDYYGQQRVGLRIKASGQINGIVDTLSAICKSRIGYVSATTNKWTSGFSENPAYQFIHFAVGRKKPDGTLIYGAGLTGSEIDLDILLDWATFCDTKKLACNVVFDRGESVYEILSTIAACGRATVAMPAGKLAVVWDEANTPVTNLYGMGNINAGTFKIDYITGDLPDQIVATYLDDNNNWEPVTIRVNAPGVNNPQNPFEMQLKGVTDSDQANRQVALISASQIYHFRRYSWTVALEAFNDQKGNVIRLAHDLTSWGASGRVLAGPATNLVTLDREITTEYGVDNWITFRYPNGVYSNHRVAYSSNPGSSITLLDNFPFIIDKDQDNIAYDYIWMFSPRQLPGTKLKIIGLDKEDDLNIRITARDEIDDYYDYENTGIIIPQDVPPFSGTPHIKSVSFSETLLSFSGLTRISISVDMENSAGFNLKIKINNGPWDDKGIVQGSSYFLKAETGAVIQTQIRPISPVALPGETISNSHTVVGKLYPPNDVGLFEVIIRDFTLVLSWNRVEDIDVVFYEIRQGGSSWETATFVTQIDAEEYVYEFLAYGSEVFWIKAYDGLKYSINAQSTIFQVTPANAPQVTSNIIDNNVLLYFSANPGSFPIEKYEIRTGATLESPEEIKTVYGTFTTFFEAVSGTYVYWIAAIDKGKNYGQWKRVSVKVNQPPDYRLNIEWDSDFSLGTKVNTAFIRKGVLLGNLNTTETIAEHFINNSWSTPQDQIDAGYPRFFHPAISTGSYEEEFDYEATLPSTNIRLLYYLNDYSEDAVITPTISYKLNSGDSWTDNADTAEIVAENFRYVKIRFDISMAGDEYLQVFPFKVRLDSKIKRDSGTGSAVSTDSGGTEVLFGESFIDIVSISVSPKGNSALNMVYDYVDVPNPTGFTVYAFDSDGIRTDGDFSWNADGY
jgi:predicted phage tail protein